MRYRKIRKNPFRKDVRSIMIDHVRIEAVMKKLKRSFTMRTVFLAVATVALLTSTAIFMSVGAAGEVTPSDLTADAPSAESGTESEAVVDEPSADEPEGSGEESEIPQGILTADASADFSIVSPTDTASVSRIVSPSEMLNLGTPVATMTTAKSVDESFNLYIEGTDVYVDYGDGTPVAYAYDGTVRGSGEIKLYGNITSLSCWSNQLTSLDVSGCAALTYLNCYDNQLTALDVSNNTALTNLDCESNQLTTLDVPKNTTLTRLWCFSNQLTSLDVSHNTALTELSCYSNQLTSLDVSGCTALQSLNCWGNQLTSLDVSSNSNLTYLMCSDNPMITSLDVSNNAALVYLICQEIRLTRLDVTHNPNLEVLVCDDSPIGSIDLSQNSKLREFQCCACNISSLNLSNNKELEFLCINGNNVSELDLFNNTKLKTLKCNGNELTSLDLSQNLNLTTLVCDVNYMTMPTIYGFNAGNSLTEFQYAPQTHVIPSNVKAGESINLSSEASVDGTATVFTWYDQEGNEVTPATASGGVFTFGDDDVGKTLVCKMTNAKLPDFRDNVEVEYDDTPEDHTLRTTEVTIEAASASSDPVSSEASDPVSSDDGGNNGNNDNNRPRTPYYDLTYKQNDEIDGFRAVQYPEGTIVEINGRKFDLHSIFGIRLNIGHIDKSQRKPILDAIKGYNKSFDPDTNNIIFYEMNLEDSNQAHVNIVKGHVLICMNYPENLPKQWNKYVFHLYHQRKDGSIEEIPVNCMANGIWCTPTDFSPYVLCWDEAKIESAGTGESMVIINVMAILFFVSAMSMNLVLYRRRRLMRNL